MTPTNSADLIITADFIVPVDGRDDWLRNSAVAIRDGRIAAVLSAQEASEWTATERMALPGHVLLPGLINAHGHAAMALFRGMADDTALDTWLNDHIWPAEGRWISEEFVADGSRLAIAEMLRAGITTFSDMYFFPEAVARQVTAAGIRAQLSFPILDFPSAWGRGPDDYLSRGLAMMDEYRHNAQIHMAFGPHAPYTVGDEAMNRVAMLAAETDSPIQIHVHETEAEVQRAVSEDGRRPLQRLSDLGILGPKTQCVHLCAVTDADLELLADSGSHAVHCPRSNLKLASGFSPIAKMLESGINVAIGTDSAASNNRLDIFAETGFAALLAKGVSGDAAVLPAAKAIELATMGGAKALGLDNDIGSLEVGKRADLIAVRLDQVETSPVYDPLSQLVYACSSQQVTHSWIDGRCVMAENSLLTVDELAVLERSEQWRRRIANTEEKA